MLENLKNSEPVRLYLYSLVGPVLAVLFAKGVVSGEDVVVYTALAGAVLAVAGVEKARSVVDSPDTAQAKQEALEAEAELNEGYVARHA